MFDEKYKDKLIDTLCQLVRIPSRSSINGGEEGMIQSFIADSMKNAGISVRTFEADDFPAFRDHELCHGPDRQYKGRPTVIGEIGDKDAPALLVIAHSDTVKITSPEKWSVDPFSGQIRNGAVYGLGVGDDKWGVATILIVIQALMEKEKIFKRRVIFASTIDEENGVGNGMLLLMLAGIKAKSALYLDGLDEIVSVGNCGGSCLYLKPIRPINEKKLNRHTLQLEEECRKMNKERQHLFDRPFFKDNYGRRYSPVLKRCNDVSGNVFGIHFYTLPEEEKLSSCKNLEKMVSNALGKDFSDYTLVYDEPWFEPVLIGTDVTLVKQFASNYREIIGKPAKIATTAKGDGFILVNHADIPTVRFGISRSEGPGAVHQVDENVDIEVAWSCSCVVYKTIYKWLSDEEF